MTLKFLGQEYETTFGEIAPTNPDLTGRYRGIHTRLSPNSPTMPTTATLSYRGIAYRI